MKQLTAKEALQKSKANKTILIEREFQQLMAFISQATQKGEIHVTVFDGIWVENVKRLKDLGYTVGEYSVKYNKEIISWNN